MSYLLFSLGSFVWVAANFQSQYWLARFLWTSELRQRWRRGMHFLSIHLEPDSNMISLDTLQGGLSSPSVWVQSPYKRFLYIDTLSCLLCIRCLHDLVNKPLQLSCEVLAASRRSPSREKEGVRGGGGFFSLGLHRAVPFQDESPRTP